LSCVVFSTVSFDILFVVSSRLEEIADVRSSLNSGTLHKEKIRINVEIKIMLFFFIKASITYSTDKELKKQEKQRKIILVIDIKR